MPMNDYAPPCLAPNCFPPRGWRPCAVKAWRPGLRRREHGPIFPRLSPRLGRRQPSVGQPQASSPAYSPASSSLSSRSQPMPDLKINADHLRRDAYLYVRQSTLRQVAEDGESTQRQYALRDRAVAAGWPAERVHVIDCDLGKSGSSALARDGFQELVSEVALAKAGIVMGLEVSRLARNSADWHRLIELCALTATLILDEDGIYDPASFNDRLLLGLKGTMSEAELHILKARMRGGQLNKARRGELAMCPPAGLVYRSDGVIDLVVDGGYPKDEPVGQRWGKVEPALRGRRRSHSPTAPRCLRTARYGRSERDPRRALRILGWH